MTVGHSALARFLTMARGEAELPSFFTQLESCKSNPLCCGMLCLAHHWGCHELVPPWESI